MRISNYARPGSAPQNAPGTPGSAGGTLGSITDGSTTVSPVTEIDVVGGTVTDLGGGIAEITVTAGSTLEVKEQDAVPDVTPVTIIQVPNGGLTNNTGGNVTLEYAQRRGGVREDVQTIAASGAAQTLDLSLYNVFDLTLTASCTLTYTNPPAPGVAARWVLIVRQGGSGSYTLTYPATQKWQAADGTMTGSAPTLHTAVGAEDVIEIATVDGGVSYGGLIVGSAGVTSVGLSMPAEFSVAGSPVTSSGTLAVTKANENANTVWAGPTSGAAAAPTFRALVAADIPSGVGVTDHEHIDNVTFSGDGSTVAFTLPAAPFDAYSVAAYVAGARTSITLSGALLDTMTFGSAPASGTDNIVVDIVAVAV